MPRLIVQTDLSGTITRQTLYDIWAQASITGIGEDDIDASTVGVQLVTELSEAQPVKGGMCWVKSEQVMYVYHDEIENTGVSLWLAVGPDVFETACLAMEPIPAGAAVAPYMDRWVHLSDPSTSPSYQDYPVTIGVNQSGLPPQFKEGAGFEDTRYVEGQTAESGSWIRVGIDGLVRACFPKEDSGVSEERFGSGLQNGTGTMHVGILDGAGADGHSHAGLFGRPGGNGSSVQRQVAEAVWNVSTVSGATFSYARVKWGGGYHFNT